ncbi:hypothetical protein D3C77_707480 [compost metagenome]
MHQAADHGLGDELVAVQAAIDHQACCNNTGIAAGTRQQLGMKRDFECATDFKKVDIARLIALFSHFLDKSLARLVDNILVPAGLDKCDALVGRVLAIDCGRLH